MRNQRQQDFRDKNDQRLQRRNNWCYNECPTVKVG
jgi:hypothetical protein